MKNSEIMKVLIVEDNFISCEYLKEIVLSQSYECKTAENGKEGMRLYKEFSPDIILSDIQMPIMNGLEMLEEIRKERSNVIIVMLTAFGSEEYAVQSFLKGANNYLKKPFYPKDILHLLKRYEHEISTQKKEEEYPGLVLRKEVSFRFESKIELIPQIIKQLVDEILDKFSDTLLTEIKIGLSELLTNAIEHGNLEISSQEKTEALDENRLNELYKQRQKEPKFSARFVSVDLKLDTKSAEWIIADEGKGFNFTSIPDPTRGRNVLGLNGRGIFISRFQFNELEYMGQGNIVRAKKLFDTEKQES
ncbi:MAG: hypothetical protein CSA05_00900 [Bacteroidia bacterium]|nr:MAG: hypothetical protein CSA05_00900 [Bacteroidia bacterium]